MDNQENSRDYDLLIAGAGMAGVLLACRVRNLLPHLKIALLDQLPMVGGRLRHSYAHKDSWSLGFNTITPELLTFLQRSFSSSPEELPEAEFQQGRQTALSILSGQKSSELFLGDLFTSKGVKEIAGSAAVAEWEKVEEALQFNEEDKFTVFAKKLKLPKNSPIHSLLDLMSMILGIPDLWQATVYSIKQRMDYVSSLLVKGDWTQALQALLQQEGRENPIDFIPSCLIVESKHTDSGWKLVTEKGVYSGKVLAVSQSPWEAIKWLDQKPASTFFLSLAQKCQPVSLVTLTYKLADNPALPDVTWIPREGVQALYNYPGDLCLQALIEYEVSLESPSVVKAVRSLKRAFKKFTYEGKALEASEEFIALHPYAWTQAPQAYFKRFIENFDYAKLNSKALLFCGDAYGDSYNPDRNLIRSLLATCAAIGELEVLKDVKPLER